MNKNLLFSSNLLSQAVPICFVEDLVSELPVKTECFGLNIVVWKDPNGNIFAVEDKCPHRGTPLSSGRVKDDQIQCPYHGLIFGGNGECRTLGREYDNSSKSLSVRAFLTGECLGMLWISTDSFQVFDSLPDIAASDLIYSFSDIIEAEALLVIDNLFDTAHFPYVHTSSFSSQKTYDPSDINVSIENKTQGFRLRYQVPVEYTPSISELFEEPATIALVVSEFIAPFTQIFCVKYDNGIQYKTAQIVTPIQERKTKLFQVCWKLRGAPSHFSNHLELIDQTIWAEDKEIIELSSLNSADTQSFPQLEVHSSALVESIEEVSKSS